MRHKASLTDRINESVLRAAAEERRKALWVVAFFVVFSALAVSTLIAGLVSGDFGGVLSQFLFFGLLLPGLHLLVCVAARRAPGAWIWVSALLGGALMALGPMLALVHMGWGTEILVQGRWASRYLVTLREVAIVTWVFAGLYVLAGVIGLLDVRRSRRDR